MGPFTDALYNPPMSTFMGDDPKYEERPASIVIPDLNPARKWLTQHNNCSMNVAKKVVPIMDNNGSL